MRTTSLLMLLQIGSRLLTFVLNALVARQIGPALYGIANVHFYLVYTTILFVAREGLRRACLRSGSFANPSASTSSSSSVPSSSFSSELSPSHPMRDKLVEIINLVWLCGVPLAIVLSLALGGLAWAHPPLQDPHYTLSLGLYVASALIEMVRFSPFVSRTSARIFIL
jgi:oligosaccharide translocation protein RFT1